MNRVFRLVWNSAACNWAAAPETSSCRGGIAGGITGGVLLAACCQALALPQGAQVSAGSGGVSSAGATMTVTQDSQHMAVNWQRFGIGAGEAVRFVQPNSSAIALNRVLGAETSQIAGRLSANGQVWLLNPNGVLFSKGAAVNVGSLLASTLDVSDRDFMAFGLAPPFRNADNSTSLHFTGRAGTVSNAGAISTTDGGYVAFLGGRVSNDGLISARLGSVALGAGSAMTLDFVGDRLLNVQVDAGLAGALASNNSGGSIEARGGNVLLTAKTAGTLLQTAVNNTGIIQAQSLDITGSSIRLLAGQQDVVAVNGTLDASAAGTASGGSITTSGAVVSVGPAANVLTRSDSKDGRWTIDTNGFSIDRTGDAGGDAIGKALDQGNVTVQTRTGNIDVGSAVVWDRNTNLTLSARGNVSINQLVRANRQGSSILLRADSAGECRSGAGRCMNVSFGQGVYIFANGTQVDIYFSPKGSSNAAGANGAGPSYASNAEEQDYASRVLPTLTGALPTLRAWRLVNDVNQLQAMATNVNGNYALGRNIDAGATRGWNGGAGFRSIGALDNFGNALEPAILPNASFGGKVDGLGHAVTGLVIRENAQIPTQSALFAATTSAAEIRNLQLADVDISTTFLASLVANNAGTIDGATVSGKLVSPAGTSADSRRLLAGGLAMLNYGEIRNSGANVSLDGYNGLTHVGGLVGQNQGIVSGSYASGAVSGGSDIGGLVGANDNIIRGSYADASVAGAAASNGQEVHRSYINAGGLVGVNFEKAQISDSYAAGAVSMNLDSASPARSGYIGGLVGENNGAVNNAYAAGNLSGSPGTRIGGLAGNMIFAAGSDQPTAPTVANSVWNVERTGVSKAYGELNNGAGTNVFALTTQLMAQQASYTELGWDFSNTWRMYERQGSPLLKSFLKPLIVIPGNYGAVFPDSANNVSLLVNASLLVTKVYLTDPGAWNSNHLKVQFPRIAEADVALGNAGAYTYTVPFYTDQRGYDIVYPQGAEGKYTFSPASLVIAARNDTRAFDGKPYSGGNGYTVTSSGIPQQDIPQLNGTVAYGGSAQGASAVGGYSIAPSGLLSPNANYILRYVDGTLTITPPAAVPASPTVPATPAAPVTPVTPALTSASHINPLYDASRAQATRADVQLIAADMSAVNLALGAGSTIAIKTELSDDVRKVLQVLAPGTDFGGTVTLNLSGAGGGQYQVGFVGKGSVKLEIDARELSKALGVDLSPTAAKSLGSAYMERQGIGISADQRSLTLSADAARKLLEGVSSRKGMVEATTIRTAPGARPGLGATPASSMEQVAGNRPPSF